MCTPCGWEQSVSDVEEISDVELVEHADGDVKPDVPARVISSVIGLMGFFTALVAGLIAGNPGLVIVTRALLALLICAVIGRILGTAGEYCVRDFLKKYKADRPTPELPLQLQKLYKQRADDQAVRESMKKSA